MSLLVMPLLALVLASPASGISDPLFCIGQPDGHTREFALTRAGYAAFLDRFPGDVSFDVGADSAKDWPFVHPAHRDTWAGGRAHTFGIRFRAAAQRTSGCLSPPQNVPLRPRQGTIPIGPDKKKTLRSPLRDPSAELSMGPSARGFRRRILAEEEDEEDQDPSRQERRELPDGRPIAHISRRVGRDEP